MIINTEIAFDKYLMLKRQNAEWKFDTCEYFVRKKLNDFFLQYFLQSHFQMVCCKFLYKDKNISIRFQIFFAKFPLLNGLC